MFKDIFSHIRTISHKVNLPESLVKLMPSDNPQVSGYLLPAALSIPATVYDQLVAFKAERGLESIEIAVTVILEEYFRLLQTPTDSETDTTTSRLETLEAKCTTLTKTVAKLQRATATLQASSSQPLDYQGTLLHQQSPLPLQDQGAATELINSDSVDQNELQQPAAVNDLQANQSEPEQLLTKETPSDRQSVNNVPLSVEDTEAPELVDLSASTSEPKDIEPESTVNTQQRLEHQSGETFNTPMTQADLAKRLGVATSTISRMQSKPNFPEWSKQKDPDSVAWIRASDTKLFYPQSDKQG